MWSDQLSLVSRCRSRLLDILDLLALSIKHCYKPSILSTKLNNPKSYPGMVLWNDGSTIGTISPGDYFCGLKKNDCPPFVTYWRLFIESLKISFWAGGGLWGLVNNAGIGYMLPIDWAPMRIFKRTADVNLWGLIEMTKTFLPLVKMARGRVVNFASIGGKLTKEKHYGMLMAPQSWHHLEIVIHDMFSSNRIFEHKY